MHPPRGPGRRRPATGAAVVDCAGRRVGEVIATEGRERLVVRVGLLFPVTGHLPERWIERVDEHGVIHLNRPANEVLARLPLPGAGTPAT
jgi:hypothetical protein